MTKQRPGVRRRVDSRECDGFVATFQPDGVTLRPVRTRRPDAQIYATWDQVYRWALIARVPKIPRRRRSR